MRTLVAEVPLTVVDGALVRLVVSGGLTSVERWTSHGWEPDTSTMVDEVLRGPTASAETLRMFAYAAD